VHYPVVFVAQPKNAQGYDSGPPQILPRVPQTYSLTPKATKDFGKPFAAHIDHDLSKSDLDVRQKAILGNVLNKHRRVFSTGLHELGCTSVMEHSIKLKPGTTPHTLKPYNCNVYHRPFLKSQLEEWLFYDIIEPSNSSYGYPVVMATRPDSAKLRVCCDFRKLNSIVELPQHPLLDFHQFMVSLGRSKMRYISVFDLKSAYLQMLMDEESRKYLTIVTAFGNFSFKRLPFGLNSAPSAFARLLDTVLAGIKYDFCVNYLDDIIVFSETFEDHVSHVEQLFEKLRNANLTLDPSKCSFGVEECSFLGYKISKYGIRPDPKTVSRVEKFPVPTTVKHIRQFLGLTGFFRRNIRDYATIAKPLTQLTKKDQDFRWNDEAQEAFEILREKLISKPILAFPQWETNDPERRFIVTTDGSSVATGAILSQMQNDITQPGEPLVERVIAYAGLTLTDVQRNYMASELEIFAVVVALSKFETYLRGREFILRTDHQSLDGILKRTDLMGRLGRWVLAVQSFEYEVQYRPGTSIPHADALSRALFPADTDRELPLKDDPLAAAVSTRQQQWPPEDKKPQDDVIDEKLSIIAQYKEHLNIPELTLEQIRQAQQNDPDYIAKINYLITGNVPASNKNCHRLLCTINDYIIDNGMLYHIYKPKTTESDVDIVQQLCIPVQYRTAIIANFHEDILFCHQGIARTYQAIRQHYFWERMQTDIKQYISTCTPCLKANRTVMDRQPLQEYSIPARPFERIHMDLIQQPLPSQGNHYILTMQDAFSKFLVTKPLRNKSAKTVADAILSHWIARFGIPKHIYIDKDSFVQNAAAPPRVISDNGQEFCGSVLRTLLTLLGFKQIFVSPYSSQSNGLIESRNKVVNDVLRRVCLDQPQRWSQMLPWATLAINSTHSESTGFSPFEVLHNVPCRSLLDIQLPQPPMEWHKDDKAAYEKWQKELEHIRKLTQKNLALAQTRQKKQYDKTAREKHIKIGENVFIRIHRPDFSKSHKLSPYFSGPYTVTEQVGPMNFKVKNAQGHILPRTYKLCDFKPVPLTPRLDRYKHIQTQLMEGQKFPILVPTLDKDGKTAPVEENAPARFRQDHENRIRKRTLRDLRRIANEPISPASSIEEPEQQFNYPVLPVQTDIAKRDATDRVIQQLHQNLHDDDELNLMDDIVENPTTLHPPPQPTPPLPVNPPTADAPHDDNSDIYYPVQKVHARRYNDDGTIDYLVSFQGKPAKGSREYISQMDFDEADRIGLLNKKLREVGAKNRPAVTVLRPRTVPPHGSFFNRCLSSLVPQHESMATPRALTLLNRQLRNKLSAVERGLHY